MEQPRCSAVHRRLCRSAFRRLAKAGQPWFNVWRASEVPAKGRRERGEKGRGWVLPGGRSRYPRARRRVVAGCCRRCSGRGMEPMAHSSGRSRPRAHCPIGLAVQLCWPLVGTLAAGTLAALPYGGLRLLAPNISSSRRGGVHIHQFWSCRCRAGRGSVIRYPDPSPLMTAPLLASVRDTCPGRTQCCLMALARC